ncbi:MAG: type II secretion system F family protein [Acidimicrobiia bacterium]
MPLQVFFFALLIVASVGVCVWALRGVNLDLPTRRRKVVRANLGPSTSTAPDMRAVVLSQPLWERLGQPAVKRGADLARRITPTGFLESLEKRRNFAGLDARWTLETLLAIKAALGVAGLGLGLLVFIPNPTALTFLIGGIFACAGFFAVDVVLDAKARERRTQIEHSFPNTIDQITICVESGLGLDAAIAHAARTGSGPLADELARVLQDIQAGMARQDALESLVERTDVSDVRHFVVAVGQANRYGVPVADALRVQATECRERRRSRAEERAQKMSVKLLFPLIFCILPSLFVVLLGPAAIRIANLGLSGGH